MVVPNLSSEKKKAILSFCRDNCCLYMCSLLFPFVAIPIALWLLLLRETRISWDLSLSSHVDLGWWTPQDGNQKSCSNMKHYEADQNPRLSLIIFHPYLLYTYYIYNIIYIAFITHTHTYIYIYIHIDVHMNNRTHIPPGSQMFSYIGFHIRCSGRRSSSLWSVDVGASTAAEFGTLQGAKCRPEKFRMVEPPWFCHVLPELKRKIWAEYSCKMYKIYPGIDTNTFLWSSWKPIQR